MTVDQLNAEIAATLERLTALRAERSRVILSKAPRLIGDEFIHNSTTYRVEKVEAHPRTTSVIESCRRKTVSGKWTLAVYPVFSVVEA